MYFDLRRASDGMQIVSHRQTLLFTSLNGKIIKLPKQAVELIERSRSKN